MIDFLKEVWSTFLYSPWYSIMLTSFLSVFIVNLRLFSLMFKDTKEGLVALNKSVNNPLVVDMFIKKLYKLFITSVIQVTVGRGILLGLVVLLIRFIIKL
jgi:hypothetical protein